MVRKADQEGERGGGDDSSRSSGGSTVRGMQQAALVCSARHIMLLPCQVQPLFW